MTVGDRIREARKKAKLSQKQLGEELHVSSSMIGQYENGFRNPKQETLEYIAAVLCVDVNWLRNGYTLAERDQAMKDHVARRFTEAELGKRLQDSYDSLNLEGKSKAVDGVEIIAGNPTYQKDKTPTEGRPEAPKEGGDADA